MEKRSGRPGRLARALPAVALFLLGCAENYPQTTLDPRGDFARLVDQLFSTTLIWAVVVFVLVEGALLVAIWKFRGRPDDPAPKQVHGNTTLEIVWTAIPAFILVMIAIPTVKTIFRTSDYATGEDVVQIEVIGHQWWWEFRYTDLGVVTANEMHVPVNKTVNLRMTTVDVLHSFWVPQFAAKRDVFPRRHNPMWFKAEVTGTFPGQCAEFCGIQHATMGFITVVETQEEFDAWVARERVGSPLVDAGQVAVDTTAPPDSVEIKGRELFAGAGGCIGCHAMVGTPMAGIAQMRGPNLTHFGSRKTMVGAWLENTPENLTRWLSNPDSVKQGTLMVLPRQLTADEVAMLVAYLRSHQ